MRSDGVRPGSGRHLIVVSRLIHVGDFRELINRCPDAT